MEPEVVNWSELKDDMDRMRPDCALNIAGKYAITQQEGKMMIENPKEKKQVIRNMLLRYYLDIPWLLQRKGFSSIYGWCSGVIRLFLSLKMWRAAMD